MSLDDMTAFGEQPVAQFEPLCGWAFTYNLNPGLINQEVLNGGTVTLDQNMAVCNSGADPAGLSKIQTVRSSRYIPGVGGRAIFTAVFSDPQPNSEMVIGPMNTTDGWAIGYNGTQFGVVRKSLGIDTWFYTNRKGRRLDEKISPQKGNVFQIRYQWLGFGVQRVYIENGAGELGVEIDLFYANTDTETSIDNANLPISMHAVNNGNTTPIWVKSPSAILGLEGDALNDALSINIADDVSKPAALGTEVPLIAFRLADTYKGKANRLFSQVLRLIAAVDGTKSATVRAYSNATITGGAWAYLSEELSPLESNKTFTSISGGTLIGSFPLGRIGTLPIDLTGSFFRMYSGQNVALVVDTGGNASDVRVGLNWKQFL